MPEPKPACELERTGGPAWSGVSVLMTPVAAAVLFPVFARPRESARAAACASNLNGLALAATMYARDHDQRLPLKADRQDSLPPDLKPDESGFHRPAPRKHDGAGHASTLRRAESGLRTSHTLRKPSFTVTPPVQQTQPEDRSLP